ICALLPNLINTAALAGNPVESIKFAQHLRIVFAFGTAMFSAIMVATTLGLFLPFLFRRIGIDPAISSGPLVTTANDSISVAIYLTLAMLLTQ
ncbi:MAG: magnesium transporter, partial [Planctomycetota bacterium]